MEPIITNYYTAFIVALLKIQQMKIEALMEPYCFKMLAIHTSKELKILKIIMVQLMEAFQFLIFRLLPFIRNFLLIRDSEVQLLDFIHSLLIMLY
jgi:hypothetical protein